MTEVRSLKAGDSGILHRLMAAVFDEVEDHVYPLELIEPQREIYAEERLRARFRDKESIILGAFEGESLRGFSVGRGSADGVFFLEWIGVDPDSRERGFMRQMTEALESELVLQEFFKIFFMVSVKNRLAIEKFLNMGYKIEGVHPNHAYGWDFLSFGKVIVRREWRGPVAEEPDFDMASLIGFYAGQDRT